MKTLRKSILILLTTLALALFAALGAACGRAKTYTLTLDANGGTMSASSTLELKEGANVYDAVKGIVPEKGGLIFGAWFEGESELSASRTMPAAPLTLVARYKVGYTVEVYLQSGSEYVRTSQYEYAGAEYVGKSFSAAAPIIEGYELRASHANGVSTLVLSEDASENVFKFFYIAADTYRITYNANAPTGTTASGNMADTYVEADGTAVVAENAFSVEGYRFAGWSTSRGGSVRYAAGDVVTLSGSLALYAVWDMGYPDRFGGHDIVYLPQTERGVVILSRGQAEFRGTAAGNELTFELPNGETLRGRIFSDMGVFAFANEALAGTYAYCSAYHNPEDPEDSYKPSSTDTLVIDEFGTATHFYLDETAGAVSDKGAIIGNAASGEYLFLITEGAAAGSGFVFITGETEGVKTFSTSFGEGGIYYEFLTGDGVSGYFGESNIYLDGYGNIFFYNFIFSGVYWINEMYSNGSDFYIYRINATLQDNSYNQARDLLGYETVDGYFSLTFYTIPLSETDYGYVEPKVEAGEYGASSGGGTLELDGFRMFPDSAAYTDEAGNVSKGAYSVYATPESELLIYFTVYDSSNLSAGSELIFRIARGEDGVMRFTREESETEIAYILLEDGAFSYQTVLVIYNDESAEVAGARRASLLVELTSGQSDYVRAAEGYVTEQVLAGGNASVFNFVRTELNGSFELPTAFSFMLANASDTSYFYRAVYFVFSYAYGDVTENRYTEIADASGSGAKIWYMNVGVNSIGSIYFDAYGDAYAGGFLVDTSSYYFGNVGTFIFVNPNTGAVEYRYFELELGGNGLPVYFTEISGLEYPAYGMAADGSVDGTVHLIVRGNEALWSANGFSVDANDIIRVKLNRAGFTANGDEITELENEEGIVILSVVLDYISYLDIYEYVDIWVYYTYRAAADGEFTSSNGEKLVVDGYRGATYTNASGRPAFGTFTLSGDGKVITFTSESGEVLLFGLDGASFRLLDGVYGSYPIYYFGEWYTFTFDGAGNVTARIGNILQGDGVYNVLNAAAMEVRIFIELGGEMNTLTAALGYDGLVVLDEKTRGLFVGDDWSVLYLDGYGSGTYHAADGSAGLIVYYDVISAEDGFVAVRDEEFGYYNFLLNVERHSFSRPVAFTRDITYYAEDFSALAFSADGEVYLENSPGYYSILGNTVRLYVQEGDSGYYRTIDLNGFSVEANCTVKGKEYFPWKGGNVTFTGTIALKEGDIEFSESATLTFTPNGDVMFYAAGTLTVGGVSYAVTVVNRYWDYRAGAYRGLALYDETIYEYSPFTDYAYSPSGESTFEVQGGLVTTTMYDGFEETERSYLTESYVGFGPIRLSETHVSGMVYANGVEFTLSNASVEAVLASSADMGNRYMAVFTMGGTQYAVFYYKFDGDYWLYMVATYEVVEGGGYSVGVARYFASNDGFTFPSSVKRGTPFGVVLYEGTGEAREVVMAYNAFFNADGRSAWLIALGDYDVTTGLGDVGSIYSVQFADEALTTVTVAEYALMQGTGSFSSVYYFANFFVGENGEIVAPAAIAVNSGDGYEFVSFTSMEQAGENTWVFHATDGYDYFMSVVTDENGAYVTDEDGNWQITLYTQIRG